MTIKMQRPDDGKTADIHPDEVENMRKHGWRVIDQVESAPVAVAAAPSIVVDARFAAKGPRGLWYVMKDGDRISSGYATEADALASIGDL